MSLMRMSQTCTYWPPGVFDGEKYAFGFPQTLACRWQDVTKLVRDKSGKEVVSAATVYLAQTVDSRGRLLLGTSSSSSPPVTALEPLSVGSAVGLDGAVDHWKVYL